MQKQPYRLFNVGPQKSSLGFATPEAEACLITFCHSLQQKIGEGKSITLFPHRVVQNHWAIELSGSQQSVHLLLNITGRSLIPSMENETWPARLVIDMADHVDAYWFSMFLAQQLKLSTTIFSLSTSNGGNTVDKNEVCLNE